MLYLIAAITTVIAAIANYGLGFHKTRRGLKDFVNGTTEIHRRAGIAEFIVGIGCFTLALISSTLFLWAIPHAIEALFE